MAGKLQHAWQRPPISICLYIQECLLTHTRGQIYSAGRPSSFNSFKLINNYSH